MKSYDDLIQQHLTEFYIFIHRDTEKKIQELAEKINGLKDSEGG